VLFSLCFSYHCLAHVQVGRYACTHPRWAFIMPLIRSSRKIQSPWTRRTRKTLINRKCGLSLPGNCLESVIKDIPTKIRFRLKIEQEPHLNRCRAQVIQKLGDVFISDLRCRFNLHNNPVFHQQVCRIYPDHLPMKLDLYSSLPFNLQVHFSQGDHECILVNPL
jgi:hypothetical protein